MFKHVKLFLQIDYLYLTNKLKIENYLNSETT